MVFIYDPSLAMETILKNLLLEVVPTLLYSQVSQE